MDQGEILMNKIERISNLEHKFKRRQPNSMAAHNQKKCLPEGETVDESTFLFKTIVKFT